MAQMTLKQIENAAKAHKLCHAGDKMGCQECPYHCLRDCHSVRHSEIAAALEYAEQAYRYLKAYDEIAAKLPEGRPIKAASKAINRFYNEDNRKRMIDSIIIGFDMIRQLLADNEEIETEKEH